MIKSESQKNHLLWLRVQMDLLVRHLLGFSGKRIFQFAKLLGKYHMKISDNDSLFC